LIGVIIDQFTENPAITSISELFDRYKMTYEKLKDELKNSNEDYFLSNLDGLL
jgi:hypothetical protein